MKDETKVVIIDELVGLKSKMYSLAMVGDEKVKTTKCVNRNVVNIRHKEYVDVLFGKTITRHCMSFISFVSFLR